MKNVKVDEWLDFFRQYKEKKLFSLSDFIQLTGENKSSISVQLTRLVKSGVVCRAAQVWYENPFASPTPEEVAMVVRHPAYLSMEYALSKQGILSQVVYTITLITTKLPYTYNRNQTIYEYHQVRKHLFWGYKREGTVLTAEPEKALLDLIYIRYVSTREISVAELASLVNDMYIDGLNKETLHSYAERFNPVTRKVLNQLKI